MRSLTSDMALADWTALRDLRPAKGGLDKTALRGTKPGPARARNTRGGEALEEIVVRRSVQLPGGGGSHSVADTRRRMDE